MRPERPKDGRSESHRRFELRAHLPLALLLATGALAAAAPVVTAEPGGNGKTPAPASRRRAEVAPEGLEAAPAQGGPPGAEQ